MQIQGQTADLTDLQRILNRSKTKLTAQQQQNITVIGALASDQSSRILCNLCFVCQGAYPALLLWIDSQQSMFTPSFARQSLMAWPLRRGGLSTTPATC